MVFWNYHPGLGVSSSSASCENAGIRPSAVSQEIEKLMGRQRVDGKRNATRPMPACSVPILGLQAPLFTSAAVVEVKNPVAPFE